MKFRVLGPAHDDLRHIDDWVAEHFGKTSADKALNKLYELFSLLAVHQEMGVARPDLTERPVRFFASHPNWIVYEPGEPLLVHRVFPARMDIQNLSL